MIHPQRLRGKLVAVSGPEGAGKSTLLKSLSALVPDALLTFEPGDSPFGRRMRELILTDPVERTPVTELLMFMADRAEHVATVLEPALAAGRLVVTDRYMADSFAYQWYAKMGEYGHSRFFHFHDTLGIPEPDLQILLDLAPEIGLRRKRRAADRNRFDDLPLEFHERVRRGFQRYLDLFQGQRCVIDASQPPETVIREAQEAINRLLIAPVNA